MRNIFLFERIVRWSTSNRTLVNELRNENDTCTRFETVGRCHGGGSSSLFFLISKAHKRFRKNNFRIFS